MKEFLKENKIVLAVIVGALIVGAAIYFSPKKAEINTGQTGAKTCENVPELPDETMKLATKIIDGDTFLIEGGYSVRILGIDADERGYPCYDPAKNRLEELILNQEVRLEKGREDLDQYCRYLRYVFLPASAKTSAGRDEKNISLELVREGLAVTRFSPEDVKYREEIVQAEKEAKDNKAGCKWGGRKIVEEKKTELQWEKLTTEKLGFEVVGACLAGKYFGREFIVEGKVVDTYHHLKSNTVFLNFEKAYPNQCFTGVIFSSNLYKFVQNPENYYLNKTVRIMGEVKEYQGRPQIILENPNQIEIGK
jgi:micrococcal nuclease